MGGNGWGWMESNQVKRDDWRIGSGLGSELAMIKELQFKSIWNSINGLTTVIGLRRKWKLVNALWRLVMKIRQCDMKNGKKSHLTSL